MQLRPYQSQLVADTRNALRTHRSVLLQLPTGGGKTAIASAIVASASQRKRRTLFVCHRVELVAQTSGTFERAGVPHSFIAAGFPYDPDALTFICSIDTLKSRLGELDLSDVELVIFDEAQHQNAAGWALVAGALKTAYQVGLSATPRRLDGRGLGAHFGTMVQGPTVAWLIEHGFLSQYRAYAPSVPDMSGVRRVGGDYAARAMAARLDQPKLTGDVILHWKRHASGMLTVVFCGTVAHAEHVAAQFNAAGIPAASLDGSTSRATRADTISRFAKGELTVLCQVNIFTEGFDLSAVSGLDVQVDCVVLLRATMSVSLYLQMVGRALRPRPGKTAVILDHGGNCLAHGLPCDEREWSLDDTAKKKRAATSDGPPPPVTCGGCFGQVRRPVPQACPYCDHELHEPPELPRVSKGELRLLEKQAKAAQREEAAAQKAREKAEREAARKAEERRRRAEEAKCKTFNDFLALGKKRRYQFAFAWAEQRIKARRRGAYTAHA